MTGWAVRGELATVSPCPHKARSAVRSMGTHRVWGCCCHCVRRCVMCVVRRFVANLTQTRAVFCPPPCDITEPPSDITGQRYHQLASDITPAGDIVGGSPVISLSSDIAGRFLVISSTPDITSGLVISLRLVISPAGPVISLPMSITNGRHHPSRMSRAFM